LLDTILSEVTVRSQKRSLLELQGGGREMWRAIDVGDYIGSERALWAGQIRSTVIVSVGMPLKSLTSERNP